MPIVSSFQLWMNINNVNFNKLVIRLYPRILEQDCRHHGWRQRGRALQISITHPSKQLLLNKQLLWLRIRLFSRDNIHGITSTYHLVLISSFIQFSSKFELCLENQSCSIKVDVRISAQIRYWLIDITQVGLTLHWTIHEYNYCSLILR